MNERNKALIITGIILFAVAITVFIIGGIIAGWDFAAWFKSPACIWTCVLLGLYFLIVGAILIMEKINRL